MNRLGAMTLTALVFTGLIGCNPVENLNEADEQIDLYQTHYSFDELDEMYAMTGPEFRKTASREEFDEFVSLIDGRMGEIEASERINFSVNSTPAGTRTVVVMQSQFEQGEGTETYTFMGSGEEMKIEGWFVNSDRLVLTADDLEVLNEAQAQEEPAN